MTRASLKSVRELCKLAADGSYLMKVFILVLICNSCGLRVVAGQGNLHRDRALNDKVGKGTESQRHSAGLCDLVMCNSTESGNQGEEACGKILQVLDLGLLAGVGVCKSLDPLPRRFWCKLQHGFMREDLLYN